MTKRVEGDVPKLPMVLYDYLRLLDGLEKKQDIARGTPLEAIFEPMIKITKKYMNLAIECDTVIMATYLHPAWRMMLFTKRFENHLVRIEHLINQIFHNRDSHLKSIRPSSPPKESQSEPNTTQADSESEDNEFNFYPKGSDTLEVNTEMDRYNTGSFPLETKGDVLAWWKVSLIITSLRDI
ncbi:hypothetical protein PGTUg99_023479 [Puccinia graminis f. sp. tritici]|uniref:hAT-like transposase RNase-H fold domain-containing protein n=1 Tax=Puccinia graminis f. sp. tritici TaxID=56615 RepID=A0A5B0R8U1_PUCGR|nr:hypothetical protein PGTUg99_023479 [Puccinia graminis f. sp. tritici]